MTPKEKALELFEAMRTPIGESDLHIPPWISENSAEDYPIEERQVAKECALIAVEEIYSFMKMDDEHNDDCHMANTHWPAYWRDVKEEINKL